MEALGSNEADSNVFFVLELLNLLQFYYVLNEVLRFLVILELVFDLRQKLPQIKRRLTVALERVLYFLADLKLALNHEKQMRHRLALRGDDVSKGIGFLLEVILEFGQGNSSQSVETGNIHYDLNFVVY